MLTVESSVAFLKTAHKHSLFPREDTATLSRGPLCSLQKAKEPENELHSTLKLSIQERRTKKSRTKITNV